MYDSSFYQTINDFHSNRAKNSARSLIESVVSILRNAKNNDQEQVYKNLNSILGEQESRVIFSTICNNSNVSFDDLLTTLKHIGINITPKLLLHVMLLPPAFVANTMNVDLNTILELLAQLRNTFTMEDTYTWLVNILTESEKARLRYQNDKDNLLHGLAVVNQPVDTAEERRIRRIKQNPHLVG